MKASIGRYLRCAASTAGAMLVIALLAPMASAAPRTVVTFTFDNDTASQYTLGYQQALRPHGMAATFFASSGTVGAGPGFMTWAQLGDLQANGNEIGGRTTHFTDLTAVPAQTAIDETCGDRQALMSHGLNISSFAYPYGASNQAAEDIVASCGYGVARSGGGIGPGGSNVAGPHPPVRSPRVAAYAPSGQITAAVLRSLVTDASAGNGGWIPVVIQNVCSQSLDPGNYAGCRASGGNIELSELNAFLDWLAATGQAGGAPADTAVQTMRAPRHVGRHDRALDDAHVRRRPLHDRSLRQLHQRDAGEHGRRLRRRQHPLHDGRLGPHPLQPHLHRPVPAVGLRDAAVPLLGPRRQRERDRFAGPHHRVARAGHRRAGQHDHVQRTPRAPPSRTPAR